MTSSPRRVVGRRPDRALVQAEVVARHLGPRRLSGLLDAATRQLAARGVVLEHRLESGGEGLRVAGRDEKAGVADHVGEGARVARDDRDAASHRLDDDAAELLQPAGRRQATAPRARPGRGRSRAAGPGRPSRPARRGRRCRARPPARAEPSSSGPAPATRRVARSRRATASRSTWTPLWGSSRPTYPMTGTLVRRAFLAWREALGVDAQRDQGGRPGEPLALADAARLGVAHAQRGGVAQGPPLEPPERRWVALVDVLGGVQDVRRPLAAQPPQQQDLGGRQGERLLVDVDDVVRPSESAPQRQRASTRRAPGGDPRCGCPVTGSPGRATRATSEPPSFHRRAVRRSTSAPRARRWRSRSRHASTTALWKIRRTRISLTPRAEYRPQAIVNRSDGLENRHPSPPPGPGRGSRERGVRSEVARLPAGPPHPLADRRGVHPGRHRRRRRADLHPDSALHRAGEVLPRREAELLGQGRLRVRRDAAGPQHLRGRPGLAHGDGPAAREPRAVSWEPASTSAPVPPARPRSCR